MYDRQVTGNLEREQQTLESWARTYPRDRDPHGLLSGFASIGTGKYELSIEEAEKAIPLDPDTMPAYANLAVSNLHLNRLPNAEAAHFKPALKRPEDYEKLMATMKAGFTSQGKEGILKAQAVEDRLMHDTWQVDGYDLLPKLRTLSIPTLVISGDHDFIPSEIALHIARAIPNARLVTLRGCGHFAYLECAGDVRAFNDLFRKGMRLP
jgi:pimeloyl-ACP methyl ester carboxylesterase